MKGEPEVSHLPKEFELGQDLSWFLHNTLVSFVKVGQPKGLFDSEFTFSEEERTEIEALSGRELYDWLIARGEYDFAAKNICLALISDFCHYIYTGLDCSQLGKQSVAFTVFRKPFKENLLYLEWLLTEPQEMLHAFHWGDVDERDAPRLGEQKRREIIAAAVAKTSTSSMFDAEFIYELRYDKKAAWGLERQWNPAVHLTTGNKNYATALGDLNFVFIESDAMHYRWQILDSAVPYLLYYTVEMVESLLSTFAPFPDVHRLNVLRRQVGFILYGYRRQVEDASGAESDEVLKSFGELIPDECPSCLSSIKVEVGDENYKSFLWNVEVICPTCGTRVDMKPKEGEAEMLGEENSDPF